MQTDLFAYLIKQALVDLLPIKLYIWTNCLEYLSHQEGANPEGKQTNYKV